MTEPAIEAAPADSSPRRIAQALRTGAYPGDPSFDDFLPPELRQVSAQHWTPVTVAARVAQWCTELKVRTVLDIGSGAGKFCVAAACAGHARFIGLEQRPRLVAAARALARTFEVESRVRFIEGALASVAVPIVDAYYLFNPFGENALGARDQVDQDVEFSRERHARDIGMVEYLLRTAPEGTHVITYNGFGGRVPNSYQELRIDRDLPDVLRMWRKGGGAGRRRTRGSIWCNPDAFGVI